MTVKSTGAKLDQEDADPGLGDRDGGEKGPEFLADQVAKLLSRIRSAIVVEETRRAAGGRNRFGRWITRAWRESRHVVLTLVDVFVDLGERLFQPGRESAFPVEDLLLVRALRALEALLARWRRSSSATALTRRRPGRESSRARRTFFGAGGPRRQDRLAGSSSLCTSRNSSASVRERMASSRSSLSSNWSSGESSIRTSTSGRQPEIDLELIELVISPACADSSAACVL